MKILFYLLICTFVHAEAFAGKDRVYFLDGYFYRKDPKDNPFLYDVAGRLKKHVENNYPAAQFYFVHNTQDGKVCNELLKLSPEEFPNKLVLIGHSYGTGAALAISNCLGSRKVDLLVLVDGITRFQGPFDSTIPENVNMAANFFQTQDLGLRGNQGYSRVEGSKKGMISEHLTLEANHVSYHWNIIGVLTRDGGEIFELMDRTLLGEQASESSF